MLPLVLPQPTGNQQTKVTLFQIFFYLNLVTYFTLFSYECLLFFLIFSKTFSLESAVDETSRQLGFLRTPGATPRSTSPADREVTPFSTPKSQTGYTFV